VLGDRYQIALITLGGLTTALMGYFFYQELFPEYRIYQKDYVALEEFRSGYTGEPAPLFKEGIKQIVIERADKGPAFIDRCSSCHVALQFEHFSPTKLSYDDDGKVKLDAAGKPLLVENESYVWKKLDEKIEALEKNKDDSKAAAYRSLKTASVDGHIYDVTKVLRMHPLIGKETRPFEFHPIDEYGCTSCHNGNGKALTTEKAHGPVFDGHYEVEDIGFVPDFTEKDPDHDPLFSKVFNSKPGHALLFQTSPIYVGALIQAKCANCHELSQSIFDAGQGLGAKQKALVADLEKQMFVHAEDAGSYLKNDKVENATLNQMGSDVDALLSNYKNGQQLFIQQACYACHRIAGFSRGGVGPDLTQEGLSYPWFVKQSIVWPQADLKTSTMPNFKLDHDEVEDLVTYLLAQTGSRKTVGEMAQKIAIKEWEAGKKLPFELPSTPVEQGDVRYGMSVFALEGCAACHRLKGFESDVGFAIEKSANADFDAQYQEKQWFRSLVPEEIVGSELVDVLKKHGAEIDKKIVPGVRSGSILEEIEKSHPGAIESLYTHFKFASRAEDSHEWKGRVHNVLMMYIQEYGLGRLVGPRPNWSGIYRSDEWLMEHFRNPGAHVARSIMPVFPFDDTKFFALTHMLDVLGRRNQKAEEKDYLEKGFNPELAYTAYCAQCHGDHRYGNGPVAEWIYPVPKNLLNFEFMRSLTKERAFESIKHGVKGTPMPPWGEYKGGSADGHEPVMSDEMISRLVDWLFASLPGATVIRGQEDVPKWQYGPKDFLKDLIEEGALPKDSGKENSRSERETAVHPSLAALPKGEGLLVYNGTSLPESGQSEIEKIFDIRAAPVKGVETNGYYIKKKYYTHENIEAGRKFFELNCAVCHGKDADGAGLRAGMMQDAKPRMLVNFDWLSTRDDLRLLRSIKYGVPGTSMNPWGDLTSALQRLQLVIFIRSLTEDKQGIVALNQMIWEDFDESEIDLEKIRSINFSLLEKLNFEQDDLLKQKKQLYERAASGDKINDAATALFQKELSTLFEISRLQAKDEELNRLKSSIREEKAIYQSLGRAILTSNEAVQELVSDKFFAILEELKGRISDRDGQLKFTIGAEKEAKIKELVASISVLLKRKIEPLEKEKTLLMGQLPSKTRDEQQEIVQNEIEALNKLNKRLETDAESAFKLRDRQRSIVEDYTKNENVP